MAVVLWFVIQEQRKRTRKRKVDEENPKSTYGQAFDHLVQSCKYFGVHVKVQGQEIIIWPCLLKVVGGTQMPMLSLLSECTIIFHCAAHFLCIHMEWVQKELLHGKAHQFTYLKLVIVILILRYLKNCSCTYRSFSAVHQTTVLRM